MQNNYEDFDDRDFEFVVRRNAALPKRLIRKAKAAHPKHRRPPRDEGRWVSARWYDYIDDDDPEFVT